MRNWFFRGMLTMVAVVSMVITVGGWAPSTRDEWGGADDLIAELELLEIRVEYGKVAHPREAKHADEIERVRLGHYTQASELPERAIAILAALPNLRELWFTRVSFPPAWLLKLKDSQRLEHLSIHNVPDAFSDPNDLDFLTAFPRLQSLGLSGCNLTDDDLEKFLVLQNLTTLRLGSNQITEAGLATLMKIDSLQHLELTANRIGGSMLDVQRYAAKLKYLSIGSNPVYSQVRNLDRLKYLAAPYTGDAPRTNFEKGFRQIAGLPSLRLFKMPGAALTDASFGEPSDSWPPPALYEVDVRDTGVTGAWLERLTTVPTLRIVRIGECWKISKESKSTFRQRRPDIQLDERTLHRPQR